MVQECCLCTQSSKFLYGVVKKEIGGVIRICLKVGNGENRGIDGDEGVGEQTREKRVDSSEVSWGLGVLDF